MSVHAVACFGVPFRFEVPGAVWHQVQAVLPPGTVQRAQRDQAGDVPLLRVHSGPVDGATLWTLWEDDQRLTQATTVEDLLIYLRLHVRARVIEHAPDYLFVHAGVVTWNGRLILLPGFSHAGKTTLVMALLRAGATYYSDDYAPIDRTGLVHPYPVPLATRNGNAPRSALTADDFDAPSGTTPQPISLVVFTAFEAGATWNPVDVPRATAVHQLLPHTPSTTHRFDTVLRWLTHALTPAHCVASPREDADAAATAILTLADAVSPGPTRLVSS